MRASDPSLQDRPDGAADAAGRAASVSHPEQWSDSTRQALAAAGLDELAVAGVISRALAEDFADGADVTTLATVPPDAFGRGCITPREPGVLAGVPVAIAVFETVLGLVGSRSRALADVDAAPGRRIGPVVSAARDGSALIPGEPAIVLHGSTSGLLTAERTALNLLGHLTGVATATRRWVDAVAGTRAVIRDTRKTLPGLRSLEKYAVRCGGGTNHRMSLGDAALIKDNHVAAAGSVRAAIEAVRSLQPDITLEVEVDTLQQFDEAVAAGAGLVLLDNFSLADTAEAVRRRDGGYRKVLLESSGGLSLDRAAAVAATGVDYLAIGALTHSAPVVDLGLDLDPTTRTALMEVALDSPGRTGSGARMPTASTVIR